MFASLLLAAALSHPAPASRHELTGALGYGFRETQLILVASWTGRRRWGAWFRIDQPEKSERPSSANPAGSPVSTSAASVGVAWRALPPLTVGVGYGQREEKTVVSGSTDLPDEFREDEHGLAAMGTWTFPVNATVAVAASATVGPGGFGAAVGATLYFP